MTYSLALLSSIPVVRRAGHFETLDLWARDIETQATHTSRLFLICPIRTEAPANWPSVAPLPPGTEVFSSSELGSSDLCAAVAGCDVVQVPGNHGWSDAGAARWMIRVARQNGAKSIVGISSNRARAAVLNARRGSPVSSLKGLLDYASIRFSQHRLTRTADAAFIVGEGLRPLVSGKCRHLHVSIASWIRQTDLDAAASAPGVASHILANRLCVAARLERMKGTNLAIEALAALVEAEECSNLQLTILGAGPERDALEQQARSANVAQRVVFAGVKAYPDEFLSELRKHGWVILTNLSDEQPRLVFDAISQGCVPVCPRTRAYESLGLPDEVLYRQGNSVDLAQTIRRLRNEPERFLALRTKMLGIARRFTLEAMHAARASWIEKDVLARAHLTPQ